jgi:hypothetical protein
MKIFILLATMLFLFEIASTPAKAESWVLWLKNETINHKIGTTSTWEIVNAYPDFNKCVQAKKQVWLAKTAQYKKLEKEYNSFDEVDGTPYDFISTKLKNEKDGVIGFFDNFYCLPGTLDPRDRK